MAVLLMMAMPLLWTQNAAGADAPRRADASARVRNQIDRERQFLLRLVDDLNRSQGYVQMMVNALEKHIGAVDIPDPSKREQDGVSFLEWYRSYAEWLGSSIDDREEDLSRAYSEGSAEIVTPDYCEPLLTGYQRLGSELEQRITQVEKNRDRALQRIAGLRSALDFISSAAFIEERKKERENKQNPQSRHDKHDRHGDERYERYKDITDNDIAMMQLELKDLEELQKHFIVLLEMGRMELFWISRKIGDYEALGQLANVIGRDAPRSLEDASDRMIKHYDADIAYFKRKSDDISGLRGRLVPAGSLRTLDRIEDLAENYEQMKSRFEHHKAWLAEQVGAYRADIVVLRNAR
ncbi:MAG TPA: hypothetical protein VIX18_12630 [Nitrospirota bacterium]